MAIGDLASKGYVQNFVSSLIKKMIDGKKISDGKHKYSEEEQVVAQWIDGKPIYEKTYKLNNITISTSATQVISYIDNIAEFENVINGVAIRTKPNAPDYIPIACFFESSSSFKIFAPVGSWGSINYMVIQYTKTTD